MFQTRQGELRKGLFGGLGGPGGLSPLGVNRGSWPTTEKAGGGRSTLSRANFHLDSSRAPAGPDGRRNYILLRHGADAPPSIQRPLPLTRNWPGLRRLVCRLRLRHLLFYRSEPHSAIFPKPAMLAKQYDFKRERALPALRVARFQSIC
jgi:hypothetical protein